MAIFNFRIVRAAAAAALNILINLPAMLFVYSSMHFDGKFAFIVADPRIQNKIIFIHANFFFF